MVTQRIANPFIPVRFWTWPPKILINKMIDKEIIKFSLDTRNCGYIKNYSHFSKSRKSLCGDEIKIYLLVKKNKIIKFKYQINACLYCQASISLLSKLSKNKQLESVKNFLNEASILFDKKRELKSWNKFEKIFNKKNNARKECLLLPLKTMFKALNN